MLKSFAKVVIGCVMAASLVACGGGGDDPPKLDTWADVFQAVVEVGCHKAAECDKLKGQTEQQCIDKVKDGCNTNDATKKYCAMAVSEADQEKTRKCLDATADLACDTTEIPAECPQIPAMTGT